MFNARRLILAHFAVAFAAFALALLLGEWQMVVRSPLHAWVDDPEHYYRSVTAHGSAIAYVFPTLVAMGFGYAKARCSRHSSASLLSGGRRHDRRDVARSARSSTRLHDSQYAVDHRPLSSDLRLRSAALFD